MANGICTVTKCPAVGICFEPQSMAGDLRTIRKMMVVGKYCDWAVLNANSSAGNHGKPRYQTTWGSDNERNMIRKNTHIYNPGWYSDV